MHRSKRHAKTIVLTDKGGIGLGVSELNNTNYFSIGKIREGGSKCLFYMVFFGLLRCFNLFSVRHQRDWGVVSYGGMARTRAGPG